MHPPRPSRPYMPGYGILAEEAGTGLLPWSWAEDRLGRARNYWISTVRPDGGPHAMPVWAMWDDGVLWFTSGIRSRKVRNLAADPRCVATTEDASDPVIMEGTAQVTTDADSIQRVLELMNEKYATDIGIEFLDPAVNATIRIIPRTVIGMRHGDFTGSPTRWTFGG
jgi:PPOX class probable F420-dependent enzyme